MLFLKLNTRRFKYLSLVLNVEVGDRLILQAIAIVFLLNIKGEFMNAAYKANLKGSLRIFFSLTKGVGVEFFEG